MSYDLHLLRCETVGDDPEAAYLRLEELVDSEPTADEQALLRELAADLQRANPSADIAENSERFGLQLGYEAERPVVIDIDSVDAITMMWSYGAEDAGPALDEVRLYFPVFERYGYVAFDPQLDRLFDPNRDIAAAAEVHADVRESVLGDLLKRERPSFLKRLFGR